MSSRIEGYNSYSILYKTIITYLLAAIPLFLFGQENQNLSVPKTADPILETEFAYDLLQDTITIDTVSTDTIAMDSINQPVIDAPIIYDAEDSIIFSLDGQRVFLYNNAKINYQQIELTAYFIEIDLETKEIYAEGIEDSTGTVVQKPYFKQGTEEFESETMRYNFDSQKAFITKVVTEQGEGFILSDRTKKIGTDVFITEKAKYTTCDADHPHFWLQLSKAKVISNEKIITGSAYMVVEDFPIYFPFLPFGYFPNSPTYSSGIIIPAYGEERNRGFFLREGGYYWAAGEYFDLAVLGDIYSKGSWGVQAKTNYVKRYKFNGGFDLRYTLNKYGEANTDTYTESPQFQIGWSHSQDPKANPNRTFSASVNFSTSGFDRQNSYNGQFRNDNYLRTQKSSSISYNQRFENTPFNMSVNLRHSQNSLDSTITLSLPELTFSMAKVYPFRKKHRSGPVKFYENFGINYSFNMRNTISTKESELLKKNFPGDWKNGIKHNIPIALPSFTLFNYINVSPSFSYNEKWYFQKYDYSYNEDEIYYTERGDTTHFNKDTIPGLSRVYDYRYSLSASTNIYGTFLSKKPNARIYGVRHKITPTIGFNYTPDFGQSKFGYYQYVQVNDSTYQYFDVNAGGIYGGSPSRGASGSISFSVSNNLEMKVRDTKDTTKTNAKDQFRKVKIIDNLSLSSSYNLIADSFNLAPIAISARTRIAGVNINMGANLDPYVLNNQYQRINKYAWNEKSGLSKLGRLTRANLSFGMNFDSNKLKNKNQEEAADDENSETGIEDDLPSEFANYSTFNIPWNFSFDYSFNYIGPNRSNPKGKFTQTLGLRGNISLTDKWDIGMNTNLDIMAGEFAYTRINVSRNLHCWNMAFNFVPFGNMKSYSFTISANASMLKDLRVQKQQSFYDNF